MSKYVKNLISDDLKQRLDGVTDALLVNVVGLSAEKTVVLRRELREKEMRLMVVKNSLARRATEGTPLAPAFEGVEGTLAIVWGGEDIVDLAKVVKRLADDKAYAAFEARGGVMDGTAMTPADVEQVSKWPTRSEQLSLLVGQILGPGANLSAQIKGPGAKLASQVKKKGEEDE